MSRGFGCAQRWLLERIGAVPMTFEQIITAAYSPEYFKDDVVAKWVRSPNFGPTSSLRRALGKLCDLGVIQIVGRRPHHYRLHPFFGGCEHDVEQIVLLCRILADEPAMTPIGRPNPLKAIPPRTKRRRTMPPPAA